MLNLLLALLIAPSFLMPPANAQTKTEKYQDKITEVGVIPIDVEKITPLPVTQLAEVPPVATPAPAPPAPAPEPVSAPVATYTAPAPTQPVAPVYASSGGCVSGWSSGDYYLDKIVAYESGGNSCATNPGGCFGLLQACPGAPLRAACGGNPSCQIAWFEANKTGGRSWAQVWQHELDFGWW